MKSNKIRLKRPNWCADETAFRLDFRRAERSGTGASECFKAEISELRRSAELLVDLYISQPALLWPRIDPAPAIYRPASQPHTSWQGRTTHRAAEPEGTSAFVLSSTWALSSFLHRFLPHSYSDLPFERSNNNRWTNTSGKYPINLCVRQTTKMEKTNFSP